MKTEQRKELKDNELVNLISGQMGKFGPYVKLAVGALLLFCAVYFVSKSMAARNAANSAKAWQEFREAAHHRDIIGLREVADRFPGTPAAAWARQTAGDMSLSTGSNAMYGDRDVATERLKEAKEDFLAAGSIAKAELLKQRALMGLAQTNEALNEFDKAEECYKKVISQWPDEAIGKMAQSHLTFLKQPSTKEFYDWFVKQEIEVPPPVPPLGGNIKPPSVYGDLRSNPGLKLPGLDDLDAAPSLGDDLAAPESGSDLDAATDPNSATETDAATDDVGAEAGTEAKK